MTDTPFIFATSVFVLALIVMTASYGHTTLIRTAGNASAEVPSCNFTSWVDILAVPRCVLSGASMIFSFFTLTSDFVLFTGLIILPLTVGITWAGLTLIRGNE